MTTEYEATFSPVEIEDARARLKKAGATLVRPEFEQKRLVLHFPKGHEVEGGFVRVRNEGDKITMTMKIIPNKAKIEDQKEWEITVSDYETATDILKTLGCDPKAYGGNSPGEMESRHYRHHD
jgi:adenylate cyclase class 2